MDFGPGEFEVVFLLNGEPVASHRLSVSSRATLGGTPSGGACAAVELLAAARGGRRDHFLGISGGNWGLMHWLSPSIQQRIETFAVLDGRIDQARETLAEIEVTTWGVTRRGIDGAASG